MSEDDNEVTRTRELMRAMLTAYVRHVNDHVEVTEADAMMAVGMCLATLVDILTVDDEDEHAEANVLASLVGTAVTGLKNKHPLREFMSEIIDDVTERVH
jgi:hypothetical protein